LQGVRGFEVQPAVVTPAAAAPATFISPTMTISASTARETRDAVAAAALTPEESLVKPAPAPAAAGWKSRYGGDES
jgi:hypothetical protein